MVMIGYEWFRVVLSGYEWILTGYEWFRVVSSGSSGLSSYGWIRVI